MKSLLEIQEEIRELEGAVSGLSQAIKNINADMDALRDDALEVEIDYGVIEKLSGYIKFEGHPLSRMEDQLICKIYLRMLLNIVRMDFGSESTISRLAFVQWMLNQSGLDLPLEEILKDSYQQEADAYEEFASVLPERLRESFVVDSLIIANICGMADQEMLFYIADICNVLGIGKDELQDLSLIAKSALCQRIDKRMKKKDIQSIRISIHKFNHYLSAEVVAQDLTFIREVAVKCVKSKVMRWRWHTMQQAHVMRGDVIASYQKEEYTLLSSGLKEEKLKAPSAGTLFQFEIDGVYYGVISDASDNLDSIKAWIEAGGK